MRTPGSGLKGLSRAGVILFLSLFVIVGWFPIIQATRRMVRNQNLLRIGMKASGTVIDYRQTSEEIWPVVRFVTADGLTVTFESLYHPGYSGYSMGQRVPVVYDPRAPRVAEINEPERLWGGIGLSYAIGLLFMAFGGGGILFLYRR